MKKVFFIGLSIFFKQAIYSQDVRIYHGEKSESVFLKQNEKLEDVSKEPVKIIRNVDGIVSISILNPNPFFYNYEIKTEDVDIVDDYSDQFSELVKLITSMPEISDHFKGARIAPTTFNQYKTSLETLHGEIKTAKLAIQKSDQPESVKEAFDRSINNDGRGFRAAIETIQKISLDKGHFNSQTLEKDLNDMLETAIKDGSFNTDLNLGAVGSNPTLEGLFKEAFQHLNNNLASLVKQIIDVTKRDRIIRFQVPVKENKKTTVKLIITKVNDKDNIDRELLNEEVAVILPLYVRKRFEIVPIVNLIFQNNRQKFSVENNLVKSAPDNDAIFNIGAMALMNFASFGELKEYGVGFGIGYSLQPEGNASSFFAIPSLSYKSIIRVGFGFGYNLAPVGLKNGAYVGEPLPTNITNIEDVIDYKRKPAAVFTIAISGLKL
ncbi:hypothetical protein I5907_11645 [Panacibacter sp. DH6]|uniref:Uncharacterized protein n=1 Tax=Panacibacter microcysteis TaxID=2793269 RepID=A0A931E841_9BACT|nr:hypothetical protein [Panacibacter microcysteis]MBG9376894.1 hypothetical protein [Panacibacter microcysteis]